MGKSLISLTDSCVVIELHLFSRFFFLATCVYRRVPFLLWWCSLMGTFLTVHHLALLSALHFCLEIWNKAECQVMVRVVCIDSDDEQLTLTKLQFFCGQGSFRCQSWLWLFICSLPTDLTRSTVTYTWLTTFIWFLSIISIFMLWPTEVCGSLSCFPRFQQWHLGCWRSTGRSEFLDLLSQLLLSEASWDILTAWGRRVTFHRLWNSQCWSLQHKSNDLSFDGKCQITVWEG